MLIQCAWSYRYKPNVSMLMTKRLEGIDPEIQAIAWKAQIRLHKKYMKLISRGKSSTVAVTAVARELLGFVWDIARRAEAKEYQTKRAA
jgi:transposase